MKSVHAAQQHGAKLPSTRSKPLPHNSMHAPKMQARIHSMDVEHAACESADLQDKQPHV